ncbi:GNAT family N-acetyltransferase [Clostridium sp. CX1]|uniref:GNAT family protein n=1 Tax=Clostridium tanneri TaxID=3037988 RepID=A0ABU4JNV9_9CLOT|nr:MULTISPECIES: GNAT family protein [unclassified Clostridium]MCT8976230.1 GNAT family N-acetyltransferase [Clostridium sp. CX1]MDW8799795.1 GNAT family protein [Clostridium sp. A1-XYC3]
MYIGKKVRLREYRKEDIPLRVTYINDPEIIKSLTPDIPYPMTLHEEEKWFQSVTALNDTYKFAIETLNDSKFIGGCSINSVDWKNSVATVGIFIGNRQYRGKGYGTDAMRVLTDFVFMQMNINKIRLIVYSYNESAIRCYEKCGYKVEGVLKQEIYKDGKYYDKISMGLLKAEYLSLKTTAYIHRSLNKDAIV